MGSTSETDLGTADGPAEEIESDRKRSDDRRRLEAKRLGKERKEAAARLEREARYLERQRRDAEERRRRGEERKARENALIERTRSVFESDFLSSDEHFDHDPDSELLPREQYLELKARFVQDWAYRELGERLDDQQAAAVAAQRNDVRVVARAGAGKTRTLVTRALFLQRHCAVPPRDLLLLAFNKTAALEIRRRLAKVLRGDLPHVMTFHALAHALVHPEEELVYDEPSAGALGLSREIQSVIDEQLQSDDRRMLVRELMLMHFRDDWERIVDGGFSLPIKNSSTIALPSPERP